MSAQYPDYYNDGSGYGGTDPSYNPDTGYPGNSTPVNPGAPAANPVGVETVNIDGDGVFAEAFGKHLVAGHLLYTNRTEGPPPDLRVVMGLGKGEWDAAEAVWYAGEEMEAVDLTDGDAEGYHFHPGTLSTGFDDAVQGSDTYLPDGAQTYSGRAYIAAKLPQRFATEERPDKLVGRYRCKKVWDYDFDGTPLNFAYSQNPADIAVWMIRQKFEQLFDDPAEALARFQARVDWQSYYDWWFFNSVNLSWNDGVTTWDIPRFECHAVFTNGLPLRQALDAIAQLSCAQIQDDGDKVRFLLPIDQTVRHTFRRNNITGTIKRSIRKIHESPRHLVIKFRDVLDPYLNYAEPVHVRRPGLIQKFGEQIIERVLPNMTHSQAQRVGEWMMRMEADYPHLVELNAAADSLHLLPGDYCAIELGEEIDGRYMVLASTDLSPEKTPEERSFRLQKIDGILYSDADHGPIQRQS